MADNDDCDIADIGIKKPISLVGFNHAATILNTKEHEKDSFGKLERMVDIIRLNTNLLDKNDAGRTLAMKACEKIIFGGVHMDTIVMMIPLDYDTLLIHDIVDAHNNITNVETVHRAGVKEEVPTYLLTKDGVSTLMNRLSSLRIASKPVENSSSFSTSTTVFTNFNGSTSSGTLGH
jgi:hypothetical protein